MALLVDGAPFGDHHCVTAVSYSGYGGTATWTKSSGFLTVSNDPDPGNDPSVGAGIFFSGMTCELHFSLAFWKFTVSLHYAGGSKSFTYYNPITVDHICINGEFSGQSSSPPVNCSTGPNYLVDFPGFEINAM